MINFYFGCKFQNTPTLLLSKLQNTYLTSTPIYWSKQKSCTTAIFLSCPMIKFLPLSLLS